MSDDTLYLHHMLERCERLARSLAGVDRPAFDESELLQDAVIRNIEVIGEAAKHVSAATRRHLDQIDWKAVCGMRDILIHGYAEVNLDIVWRIATIRCPALRAILEPRISVGRPPTA
jgi:uncharacterized protein with HEPN domain